MKTILYYLFLFSCILLITCQKEISFENGAPSKGSLLNDSTGNCYPKTVNGSYVAGDSLKADINTILVTVNVTTVGSYTIFSDTVNGYWFRGTGTFSHTGTNSITLKGYGTPVAQGVNNFLIVYDSSACNVAVTVAPAGTGAASFILLTSVGNNCSDSLFGTCTAGVALTSGNYIMLNIRVDTIGTYNISATIDSMTFSGSGTFTTTGNQSVRLNGSGTPNLSGNYTLHLIAGSSACDIPITVNSGGSAAVGTLGGAPGGCTPSQVFGTYTQGTALTSADSVHVQINVTTAGTYTISTNTVSGFSFSASGTASLGTQTITLIGTGTPTASGNITYTVTFGTSTCTFVINVTPAPPPLSDYFPTVINDNWSYNTTDYSGGTPVNDTLLMKSTGTISLNGQTYTYFLETNNVANGFDTAGYFRKDTLKNYFQWLDVGTFFGLDNPVWGEYTLLKDYVAAGTEWTSSSFAGTSGGFPVLVRFKDSIQSKDVPVIVQGQTYQNTIIVKEKYEGSVDGGSTWIFLGYSINYYSRNIGWIKYEFFDTSNATQYLQEMKRYQVF